MCKSSFELLKNDKILHTVHFSILITILKTEVYCCTDKNLFGVSINAPKNIIITRENL